MNSKPSSHQPWLMMTSVKIAYSSNLMMMNANHPLKAKPLTWRMIKTSLWNYDCMSIYFLFKSHHSLNLGGSKKLTAALGA